MRIPSAIRPALSLTGPYTRMRPIGRPARTVRSFGRVPAVTAVLLSVFAAVLAPAGPAAAAAPTAVTVANIKYTLDPATSTASVTTYTGTGGAVEISALVTSGGSSYPVTSIASFVFMSKALTSVVIPSSVTSIGDHAFSENRLTSAVIPLSVRSIGNNAFRSNNLTSVVIPSSVTSIGLYAFEVNSRLVRVTFTGAAPSLGSRALGSKDQAPVVHYTAAYAAGFVSPWNGYTTVGDLDSATPTITGTANVGGTLTAVPGFWTTGTTFAYQWQGDGRNIVGAVSSTFKPTLSELGRAITIVVTGSKAGYETAARTSTATAGVVDVLKTATPTITGLPTIGGTLTAVPGAWTTGTTLSYRWQADHTNIAGATAMTFVPTSAHAGTKITVVVTGSKAGYESATRTSGETALVGVFTAAPIPAITGTGIVGQTLTAVAGAWSPAPTGITYQWFRGGVTIQGATGVTYRLVTADAGTNVTVETAARLAGYTATSTTSSAKAVATLPFTTAPAPTITGTATVGQTLSVAVGAWSPTPTRISFLWLRGGIAIPGATGLTYRLVAADAGLNISVKSTATLGGYTTTATTSAAKAITGQGPKQQR